MSDTWEFIVRLLISIGLGLAIIMPLTGGYASASSMTPSKVVYAINEYRESKGLEGLAIDPVLEETADTKAGDIIERDYWAHTAPDGFGFKQLIKTSGYRYKVAGENLAFGYETAEAVVQAWINSPTHNQVLLHPAFTKIGIGLETGNFMTVDDITVVAAHLALPTPNAVVSLGDTSGNYAPATHLGLRLPSNYSPAVGLSIISRLSF